MRKLRVGTCIISAVACLAAACSAGAAPLVVGTPVYPVPGEADPIAGPPLDSITAPFSASPLYAGTLISEVYDDDISNPHGGITFVYRLSNNLASLDSIHRLTVNNFADYLIDASYQAPTADLPPSLVDRSAAGTVGFSFLFPAIGEGELSPGLTSALLVLQTNATTYVPTFASVINGTVTSVPSFSPDPIIPEPAGAVLLAIGAGCLSAFAYRRRSRRARRPARSPGGP